MKKPPLFIFAAALLVAQTLSTPAPAQFDNGLGLYEENDDEDEDAMAATSVTPATSQYRKEHASDEDHEYGDEAGRDIMDEDDDDADDDSDE